MKLVKLGSLPEFTLKESLRSFKGSQAPTPVLTKDGIKVYFSSRDINGRSHAFSYLLDKKNPLKLLNKATYESGPASELGMYYTDGLMPSQYKDNVLYFTGWESVDAPVVRYRVSCGKAQTVVENKFIVDKAPFLDRSTLAPCGSSMPFVHGTECFFMGLEKWHLGESFYSIYSFSRSSNNYAIYDLIIPKLEREGGLARPVIFEKDKEKYMMFCARGMYDFRKDKKHSYKLWIAKYTNNDWEREAQLVIENGEEDFMQAYGYPIQIKDKWYVFYNNEFTSAIQIAELK